MGEGNTITVSVTIQKRALWLLVQSTTEANSVLFCVGPLALTYSYFAPNSSNILTIIVKTLTWILVHILCPLSCSHSEADAVLVCGRDGTD
jgi:hypothetical protein